MAIILLHIWQFGSSGDLAIMTSPLETQCNHQYKFCQFKPFTPESAESITVNSMDRSVTIYWKAVEQYFTAELFVFQFLTRQFIILENLSILNLALVCKLFVSQIGQI